MIYEPAASLPASRKAVIRNIGSDETVFGHAWSPFHGMFIPGSDQESQDGEIHALVVRRPVGAVPSGSSQKVACRNSTEPANLFWTLRRDGGWKQPPSHVAAAFRGRNCRGNANPRQLRSVEISLRVTLWS